MAFGNLGEAFVKVSPSFAGFQSAFQTGVVEGLNVAIEGLGGKLQDAGQALLKKFLLPMGVAIGANITQWQALDAAIRETITLFGSGGMSGVLRQQFDEMEQGVYDLSKSLGVLQEGIADGLYQAISAGIPRDNVFEFLDTAQQAAIGGATELLTAVDGLTTAMNAFGYEAGQVNEVSDIMFRGVARGKTTFDELSASMARAAPLAAGAGVQFDEFIAIVAAMTYQGTQTAEAFTNIKASLTGLLRPTEELNAIWEEAGFASGEAAIQARGLQGAMDIVTTSVDGSVSALIKLLGGAEAANAVLQVTGDSAAIFNSILRDTENAAGATAQAFDTMQDGVGRAFGQLTAAFDRLGSAGGELASGFAQPVVEALTGIVSEFADWTRAIGKQLEPIQKVFKSFVDTVFNNAIVRQGVSLFATFVVTLGALGSALGLALVTAGSFVTALFGRTVIGRVGLLSRGLGLLSSTAIQVGYRVGMAGEAIKGTGAISKTVGRSLSGLGKTMQGLARIFTPSVFLGVTGAIAGLTWVISKGVEAHKQFHEQQQLVTTQSDLLADKLGLVTKELDNFEWPEMRQFGIDPSFAAENVGLISQLNDRIDDFGAKAAENQLRTIAIRWVQEGNDPLMVMDAIRNLRTQAGLSIPITFDVEDISGPEAQQNYLDSLYQDVENYTNKILGLQSTRVDGTNNELQVQQNFVKKNEGVWKDWANQVSEIFTQFGAGAGVGALEQINDVLGEAAGGDAAAAFNKAYLEGLEEASGGELDFRTTGIENFEELMRELAREFPALQDLLSVPAFDYGDPFAGLDEAIANVKTLQSEMPPVTQMTDEQKNAFYSLSGAMKESYGEAAQYVIDKQAELTQSFMDQMPLLDVYAGALDQTFTEWKKSQDQFQADFQLWQDKSAEILGGLPAEVANRIEDEPISVKAWLAGLGASELETAIAELTETYDLVKDAADEAWKEEYPAVIAEAQGIIQEKYTELQQDALRAGKLVGDAFRDEFAKAAATWAATAGHYAAGFKNRLYDEFEVRSPSRVMVDLADNLADAFSSQVMRRSNDFNLNASVQGAADGAGSSGANVTVNINQPGGQSVASMTQEALAIASLMGRVL